VDEREEETYEDTETIAQLQPDENSGTSKTSVRSGSIIKVVAIFLSSQDCSVR